MDDEELDEEVTEEEIGWVVRVLNWAIGNPVA